MIKSATIYRLLPNFSITRDALEAALEAAQFVPCALSHEHSAGWVPPREKNGALVESVGQHWIIKLMVEKKTVPSDVLQRQVDERAAEILETTGRKPGKKETKEIKEDARLALLPMAFPKRTSLIVWIDPVGKYLVVDTISSNKADEAITSLVRTVDDFGVTMLQTIQAPAAAMCFWLQSQEPPASFTIDRGVRLVAIDDSKARVTYVNVGIETDEVKHHIATGKNPTLLAMTWDARMSFVLTDAGTIKGIEFLGGIMESEAATDSFDADVALATGELSRFIPDLIEALGGEMVPQPELPLEGGENPKKGTVSNLLATVTGTTTASNDELYDKAVAIVVKNGRASLSLVQRELKIGYNRAARLIEDMEKNRVVSPMDSGGSRKLVAA